jgi:hypothetical protein
VQVGPRTTLVDLVSIEELVEDEGVEQWSIEELVQKDAKEEEVFEAGV